jgi:predicted peptidase
MFALVAATVCFADSPAVSREPGRDGYSDPASSSEALARQPQTPGAIGDQQRHYYFEKARAEIPYRLYVPRSYDARRPAPLVVGLHGFGGDQDYFFVRAEGLPKWLEKHGFIFVAPMGYNFGSWYGAGGPAARGEDTSTADIAARNGLSVTELGELDVMNVVNIVRAEYNIDRRRMFLMGHSMGGAGTWHLGQKYAHMWAALAPMSGTGGDFVRHDYDALVSVPMMILVGSKEANQVDDTRAAVDALNASGGSAVYVEIADGDHVSMISPAMPQVLDFFARIAGRD